MLADDLADPTADLVISALVLAAEHQARQLAELLGELAVEAREQAAMRMRIEAGRARTRTSVRVIVMAATMPRVGPLSVGEHTRELIWLLTDDHCDGIGTVAEENCLPAGEIRFGGRPLTVTTPEVG